MKWEKLGKMSVRDIYGTEFDRGLGYSGWRPAGSGDVLLLFTLQGQGQVGNALHQEPLPAGHLALFEMGAEQVYFTDPSERRWRFLWTHFTPPARWRQWMSWRMAVPGVRMSRCDLPSTREAVEISMRESFYRARQPGRLSADLAFNSLERVLLLASPETSQPESVDPRVAQALEILSHEIETPFSMEDLARRCGLSSSRLAHLFKGITGQSPQRFAEQRKMLHAAQLLRLSDLPVQEVAMACGYDDPYYFSNRFRRWWSLSPRAYREENVAQLPPRIPLGAPQRPRRVRAFA